MTPWSTGNHRIHRGKREGAILVLVFGGEILLVNGHSMEFLSWGIICIPSWGINREKSSRAATMVSTYNTLEKQQHTLKRKVRASTPTPPNFILATLRDQRQATKSNEGCRHHHPAHGGVIARSNSAVNGLRLEFVRIFPTAGESRDSMYCWRSLGMDNNMGD